ncbi:MAG: hypothetical protein ACOYOQ_00445 [Microthrixaceae bacterium]
MTVKDAYLYTDTQLTLLDHLNEVSAAAANIRPTEYQAPLKRAVKRAVDTVEKDKGLIDRIDLLCAATGKTPVDVFRMNVVTVARDPGDAVDRLRDAGWLTSEVLTTLNKKDRQFRFAVGSPRV